MPPERSQQSKHKQLRKKNETLRNDRWRNDRHSLAIRFSGSRVDVDVETIRLSSGALDSPLPVVRLVASCYLRLALTRLGLKAACVCSACRATACLYEQSEVGSIVVVCAT